MGESIHSMLTESARNQSLPHGPVDSPFLDTFMSMYPLIFILLTSLVKRFHISTATSISLACIAMWLIRMAYFTLSPCKTQAYVFLGFLNVVYPLCTIFGGLLVLETMISTKCFSWIVQACKQLSGDHPIAQIYFIGLAFTYLMEGTTGVGYPITAPMLAQLGYSPKGSLICCMIMNSLSTWFGNTGFPIWYGLANPFLRRGQLHKVSIVATLILGPVMHVLPLIASRQIISKEQLHQNWKFILFATWCVYLPGAFVCFFNYQFTSIVMGIFGMISIALLAKFKVGLVYDQKHDQLAQVKAIQEAEEIIGEFMQQHNIEFDNITTTELAKKVLGIQHQLFEVQGAYPSLFVPFQRHQTVNQLNNYVIRGFQQIMQQEGSKMGSQHGEPEPEVQKPPENPIIEMVRQFTEQVMDNHPLQAGHTYKTQFNTQPPTQSNTIKQQQIATLPASDIVQNFSIDDEDQVPFKELHDQNYSFKKNELRDSSDLDSQNALLFTESDLQQKIDFNFKDCFLKTLPLWLSMIFLIFTRVKQIGLYAILNSIHPALKLQIGTLFNLQFSASFVLYLDRFMGNPEIYYKLPILYIPLVFPFTLVSLLTVLIFRKNMDKDTKWYEPFKCAFQRLKPTILPLMAALVLVQLIIGGAQQSPAFVTGRNMAEFFGESYTLYAFALAMIGSFISGACSIGNLTFTEVQIAACKASGLPVTVILALQALGSGAGEVLSLQAIITGKTVMSLQNIGEGEFLKTIAKASFAFMIIATLTAIPFLFIFK